MAKLNVENFSEEFREIAPKECAVYLFECLSKNEQEKLRANWYAAGGLRVIPWCEWCMEHISVQFDTKAQMDLNNTCANRYKTPQIKQSSDPQTAQTNLNKKENAVSDCIKIINKKKYSITNDEFELYKLIMMLCKNNKFGWVNDTEFYIYVEYMHLEKFVNEFKRIFGDNVFEHVKLIGAIKSDELKIKLSKALAGCIDLNNIFPKEEY